MTCSSNDASTVYERYDDGSKFSQVSDEQDSPEDYAREYRIAIHDAGLARTKGIIEVGGIEKVIISGPHRPVMDMILNRQSIKSKLTLRSDVYIRQIDTGQYSAQNLSSPTVLHVSSDVLPWIFDLQAAPQYFLNLMSNLSFVEGSDKVANSVLPFEDELSLKYARYGSHKNGYGGTYKLAQEYPQIMRDLLEPIVPCDDTFKPRLNRIDEISLSDALRNRKSCRDHSTPAIALEDVLTLLSLSARGQFIGKGPQNESFYRFPYPSGGGLGELRFLVIANRATLNGVELGGCCIEYNPLNDLVYKHHVNEKGLHTLVEFYSHMPNIPAEELQCLILVLADAPKVAGKYESITPALIYKHVGVWMQTAYLVATELPVSVCALGGGPVDTVRRLFGIERPDLIPVGEMVCARKRDDADSNA